MKDEKLVWNENSNQHWLIGYAITINSVIGAGLLSIPWGYYEAGWSLGIFSQILSSAICAVLIFQLLQAISRTEVLWNMKANGYTINPMSISSLFRNQSRDDYLFKPEKIDTENNSFIEDIDMEPKLNDRKFDLCEMTQVLLGNFHAKLFMGILLVQCIAILTGYCTIFASSSASIIPLWGGTCNIYDDSDLNESCRFKYWAFLAIFACCVIFLTIIGIVEQLAFQITMCAVRILVIVTIVGTSIYAIASDTKLDDTGSNDADPDIVNPWRLGLCFPIIVMALFFHNTIPTTTQHVRDKPKSIPLIAWTVLITTSLFYLSIGLIVPFAADEVEKMVSLNWTDYSAGEDPDKRSWWAYVISYFVLLLPAFDVMSIFPIIAINCSDNLMSLKYGHFGDEEISKKHWVLYRLAVAIPPILIALFVYDLSYISEITGSLMFLSLGVYIPLFCLVTKRLVDRPSPYDGWFSSDRSAWAMILFTLYLFIAIWVLILIYVITE
ncbi:unnamed protein product [Blepharisma stoltei]|uniref:Amino acid transporter transmembrane domain-containing protein n=1 Tax=Blepharisma stoltei TaxID=1481888 RepID=A0AAU9J0Y0_9CILI|nr:unnamed protein product [Blepharisma stoltei]